MNFQEIIKKLRTKLVLSQPELAELLGYSFLALLLLSLLFIILVIIVKCTSKGPAFYGHERIGKNEKKI